MVLLTCYGWFSRLFGELGWGFWCVGWKEEGDIWIFKMGVRPKQWLMPGYVSWESFWNLKEAWFMASLEQDIFKAQGLGVLSGCKLWSTKIEELRSGVT